MASNIFPAGWSSIWKRCVTWLMFMPMDSSSFLIPASCSITPSRLASLFLMTIALLSRICLSSSLCEWMLRHFVSSSLSSLYFSAVILVWILHVRFPFPLFFLFLIAVLFLLLTMNRKPDPGGFSSPDAAFGRRGGKMGLSTNLHLAGYPKKGVSYPLKMPFC